MRKFHIIQTNEIHIKERKWTSILKKVLVIDCYADFSINSSWKKCLGDPEREVIKKDSKEIRIFRNSYDCL